jgi:hypothetical protein
MEALIRVDTSAPPTKQDVLHNRWHPDIPMLAWVKPGDQFRVEYVDVLACRRLRPLEPVAALLVAEQHGRA